MSFPITQAQPFTLIIYSSPLFPAHWSLFMPSSNQSVGTRIHVTGSSHSGFTHEFVRSYDLSTDTRSYKLVPLPDINFEFVSREKEETEIKGGEGGESVDVLPRNELERLALEVSAPGKSLKSLNENRKEVKTRVQLKNCQTWIQEFVELLIAKEILPRETLSIVRNAPKN